MMAWTDRHCRFLHRLISPNALLFTEMVTTGALLHGGQWHLLEHAPEEYPLALQLGGNQPKDLAACSQRAAAMGFTEINLNVGCPSDRVQKGTFGACLMLNPELVADCIKAMRDACDIPVTVKCRLGVDQQDTDELLLDFIDTVAAGGCETFYIHARKAILGGLTPAQNRSIPPLQPWRAEQIKQQRPDLRIMVNGGIDCVDTAMAHLRWADGIMIGRAAYHQPMLLAAMERALYQTQNLLDLIAVIDQYLIYMQKQLDQGTRLSVMTRHLLHCCGGMPGARRFRQILSDSQQLKRNELSLVHEALTHIFNRAA